MFYSNAFSPPRADITTEVEIKAGQEHRSPRPSLEPFGCLHFFFFKYEFNNSREQIDVHVIGYGLLA